MSKSIEDTIRSTAEKVETWTALAGSLAGMIADTAIVKQAVEVVSGLEAKTTANTNSGTNVFRNTLLMASFFSTGERTDTGRAVDERTSAYLDLLRWNGVVVDSKGSRKLLNWVTTQRGIANNPKLQALFVTDTAWPGVSGEPGTIERLADVHEHLISIGVKSFKMLHDWCAPAELKLSDDAKEIIDYAIGVLVDGGLVPQIGKDEPEWLARKDSLGAQVVNALRMVDKAYNAAHKTARDGKDRDTDYMFVSTSEPEPVIEPEPVADLPPLTLAKPARKSRAKK